KQISTLTCQFVAMSHEGRVIFRTDPGDWRNPRGHGESRELLASYLTPEPVEWTCSNCRKWGSASKKIDIARFPRVLIFHPSRYFTNGDTEKNNTLVEYDFHEI
ncbi:UBPY -like protein, partial [Caligus rogercresseyi]